jgi:malonyl-CoA/methylmalonyl-CoA synthetase
LSAKTLVDAFLASVERRGDRVLCRFGGRETTWRQARARVDRLAGEVRARGLGRGDRVALAMGNVPEFLESYLAVLGAGAAAVPVNPRGAPAEMEHVLADSGAKLVLADVARAEAIGSLVSYRRILTVDEDLGKDAAPADAAALPEGRPRPEDLALVLYTSGTTGKSKGAMLTHANLLANIHAITEAWGWTEADELLLALPLFHMHGLGVGLNGTILTGSTLDLRPRFDPADVLARIATGRPTLFFGVPTMYHRLLQENRPAPPNGVRLWVSGSAPLPADTLLAFERAFGARILERYGMSETGMLLGNPLAGPRTPGSVGVPFRGVEMKIVDRDERDVLEGETGELLVKGPNVFKGYAGNEAATRAAFTEDGWFRTGDLGHRDGDGFVFLTGRAKELIITAGFNVSPREVEEVLEAHPAVSEAAVVGLPDPDLGERVAAAVVARAPLSLEELRAWLEPRLSGYKRPREIALVEALPRNAMGKVQRGLVRESFGKSTPD